MEGMAEPPEVDGRNRRRTGEEEPGEPEAAPALRGSFRDPVLAREACRRAACAWTAGG
jgi:hypothetical protein